MQLASPWAALLLLLLPLLWLVRRWTRGEAALRYSDVADLAATRPAWRVRLAGLPAGLRYLGLACLIVALMRPREGQEKIRDFNRGIAIAMVVDRSGSMGEQMIFGGRQTNRLEAVKEVFREFVLGGHGLAGRPQDLIGLIAFARHAETLCPLTLAHDALDRFLDRLEVVRRRAEDGTAIGDAIALGAARLNTVAETLARQTRGPGDYEIKSKVLILLTDGLNNAGQRDPLAAAKLAKEWGVKIYAIGVGGTAVGRGMMDQFFGSRSLPIDTQTLKAVAEETGGFFRFAEDAESLRDIYREIDRLEKSEIQAARYLDYHERAEPYLLAALLLLLGELAMSATWWRRLP